MLPAETLWCPALLPLQITGLLSMLRFMAAQQAAGQGEGLPRHVRCIWVARNVGEFRALDAPLLLAAT